MTVMIAVPPVPRPRANATRKQKKKEKRNLKEVNTFDALLDAVLGDHNTGGGPTTVVPLTGSKAMVASGCLAIPFHRRTVWVNTQ
jgi:hypothetical protein